MISRRLKNHLLGQVCCGKHLQLETSTDHEGVLDGFDPTSLLDLVKVSDPVAIVNPEPFDPVGVFNPVEVLNPAYFFDSISALGRVCIFDPTDYSIWVGS